MNTPFWYIRQSVSALDDTCILRRYQLRYTSVSYITNDDITCQSYNEAFWLIRVNLMLHSIIVQICCYYSIPFPSSQMHKCMPDTFCRWKAMDEKIATISTCRGLISFVPFFLYFPRYSFLKISPCSWYCHELGFLNLNFDNQLRGRLFDSNGTEGGLARFGNKYSDVENAGNK